MKQLEISDLFKISLVSKVNVSTWYTFRDWNGLFVY